MTDARVRRFAGPLAAFAAMTAIVMVTGAVLFARKLGLSPERVQAFYLGSEAGFAPPRSMGGLLEVAVPHLLAVPMVLFVTLHLVAFATRARRRPFAILSGITHACALGGILAGFGIRWIWPGFAPAKIAAFAGLEATMAWWIALLVAAVWPWDRAERSTERQVMELASTPLAMPRRTPARTATRRTRRAPERR